MNEFLQALTNHQFQFLRFALIAGLLASISFGVVGTYVVARRITYLAGAIAHTAIGGIGAALYLKNVWGWEWLDPLYGALAVSIAIVPILGWVTLHAKDREDTVITALWTVGMAGGLLLIAQTPGYVDAMSYLFGDILVLSTTDLILIALLAGVVTFLGIYFYEPLLALCFDSEFARLRGLGHGWLFFLLLILTACTVVLLIRIIGVVMVIALLGIPPAIAAYGSKQLWHMILGAIFICFGFILTGLYVSYDQDLPSGPCIAFIAGGFYLGIMLLRNSWQRLLFKIKRSKSFLGKCEQQDCCKKE